ESFIVDTAVYKEVITIADGEVNPRELISNFGGYGDADVDIVMQSIVTQSSEIYSGQYAFKLINAGSANKWASAVADFAKQYDASRHKYITFWVKGAAGGEKLLMIGRDKHAKGYMPQMKIDVTKYIEGGAITTSWQKVRIPIRDLPIDIKAITSLGFELGTDTTGNAQGATLYVDEIQFGGISLLEPAVLPATPLQALDTNIYNKIVQAEQASGTEPQAVPVAASIGWIDQHVGTYSLVQDTIWPDGERSYIYPNAAIVGGLIDRGETVKAKKIADAIIQRQNADGSWYAEYRYLTGERMSNEKERVGNAAFVGMQLLKVYKATGEVKYLNSATKAANWIKQFQALDPKSPRYGSVTAGFDQNGKLLPYTPADGNADILNFYYYLGKETDDAELLARGKLIADWLVRPTEQGGVWHVKEGYFHVGLVDLEGSLSAYDEPSYVQASILMGLQATQDLHGHNPADYKDSLKWLLSSMKTVTYDGKIAKGLSLKPWKDIASIDINIMQYYIHAARSMGENDLAHYLQKQLDKLRYSSSGLLPLRVAEDSGLNWFFNLPEVNPISVGFDLMTSPNFYILSDEVRARPITNGNEIKSKTHLLNRLGATKTMFDDSDKLAEYAKS
ncbi:MAG: hypothetical protein Q8R48_04620, partial [Candidatus Omnitrophota bacterium]|nr:hypothetical protein [Candidatus Omnitrophota bacterium]